MADLGGSATRMGAPSAVPPGTGILGKESEHNTTQETRMKPLSILLLTLLVFPLPAWSKDLLLFVIQRSKNANEVQYYLRVDAHCHLASDTPVHALWKLLETSPEKTKPLSVFDQLAYGIAQQTVTEPWVAFSLKALETKRMKARATPTAPPGTCTPLVLTDIQGQEAFLERVYVQTEEGFPKPKVVYIDIFGKSVDASHTPVTERITP
jgi:hypothetical protein